MWQRFTERARKVIFYGQEEAQKLGTLEVSPEHILLGLLRESDCVAAIALTNLGVRLEQVRLEVEKQILAPNPTDTEHMTLTPAAKRTIDFSVAEAKALGNNYIGTEHLLLGLLREDEGIAAKALTELGASIEAVRTEVIALQERESS